MFAPFSRQLLRWCFLVGCGEICSSAAVPGGIFIAIRETALFCILCRRGVGAIAYGIAAWYAPTNSGVRGAIACFSGVLDKDGRMKRTTVWTFNVYGETCRRDVAALGVYRRDNWLVGGAAVYSLALLY